MAYIYKCIYYLKIIYTCTYLNVISTYIFYIDKKYIFYINEKIFFYYQIVFVLQTLMNKYSSLVIQPSEPHNVADVCQHIKDLTNDILDTFVM